MKKYMSKFDNFYKGHTKYIKSFQNKNNLSIEEINKYRKITTLICYANNGLINVLEDHFIEDDKINEKTDSKIIFTKYLEMNNMLNKVEVSDLNSKAFFITVCCAMYKLNEKRENVDFFYVLNNFDIFMYMLCIDEINQIKDKAFSKIIKLLNKAYKKLEKNDFPSSLKIIQKIITDNRDLFIEI